MALTKLTFFVSRRKDGLNSDFDNPSTYALENKQMNDYKLNNSTKTNPLKEKKGKLDISGSSNQRDGWVCGGCCCRDRLTMYLLH